MKLVLQAQLQQSGVNASQVLDGLAKVLSADEIGTIIGTLASPPPLQYSTSLTGAPASAAIPPGLA